MVTPETIFKRYLSILQCDKDREARNSTSPYAVTAKLPSSRIESTPLTYTDINTSNGSPYITTEIHQETIYCCPVTKKEFTSEDLFRYYDAYVSKFARDTNVEFDKTFFLRHPNTLMTEVKYKDKSYSFSEYDFCALYPYDSVTNNIRDFIESRELKPDQTNLTVTKGE